MIAINKIREKLASTIKGQDFSFTAFKSSLFVREFILFSFSTILYQGSRFLTSFFGAEILGPSIFGLWNMLSLILTYGYIAHLGVINAMNRDVPLFKGKGNLKKVEEIRQVSLGFISISTLLTSATIAISAILVLKDMILTVEVAVIALSAQEMEGLIQVAQRFSLDFDDAYRLTIISFDADFDRTERGRKMPKDLLKGKR